MKTLLTALLLLTTTHLAGAAVLTPSLEAILFDLADDDMVKVLVVMRDQADIAALDAELHAAKTTRAARHEQVVRALQGKAAAKSGLIADLENFRSDGRVEGWTAHWIINAVVVRGTVAAIYELAARPDVARIEADLVPELIEPVSVKAPAPRPNGDKTGFVSPGVVAVGATQVWHELGIHGTGTIVANIDSGVDGTHPALASRWLGNTVPAGQAWQDHGNVGSPTQPFDAYGHGTHVMGTITAATPFDTLGVAPGALWMASNALWSATAFSNSIITAFEWFADPDGNPATVDDVPDVLHNSWGVNPTMGFPTCYSLWWNVIDNCEAAGVVVTWSAGNEGPGPSSLRSPPDRASTATSSFSVGSTSINAPHAISNFSSRGPSACGGPHSTKPEIVAPGENIYSTFPGGGYAYMDGTSMAGPHIAGVVALMREAAPDLDVTTIKEVLMATAVDLGAVGDDNSYGHGFVDAYAAVSMVLGNAGTVEGVVRDQATSQVLTGVVVHDLRGESATTTSTAGAYRMTLLNGATQFEVTKFGYLTDVVDAVVPAGGTLTLDIDLVLLPNATLSGTVRGPDGLPVAGAEVTVLGVPLAPVTTDALGFYSFVLPADASVSYELLAVAPDLAYSLRTVALPADRVCDFDLPDIRRDGFESGDFAAFPWQRTGSALWTVTTDEAQEGARSARSGTISHGQSTTLSVQDHVQGQGPASFWYKVDSEINFDTLKFYVDGELLQTWSGNVDWTYYEVMLSTGSHTLKWTYSKDGSASIGADTVWIDRVVLPGTGLPPAPALTVNDAPEPLIVEVGATNAMVLDLANTGDETLTYTIAAFGTKANGSADKTPAWLDIDPAGGSVEPLTTIPVTITGDGSLAAPGEHPVLLMITSNDPAHPTTPVVLTVYVVPVTGVDDGVPDRLVLRGATPNPFNPATDIRFGLPAAARTTLRVFDVSGRLVRTLVDGPLSAGAHTRRWDGRDESGRDASSGVYFVRLLAGADRAITSMTLIR